MPIKSKRPKKLSCIDRGDCLVFGNEVQQSLYQLKKMSLKQNDTFKENQAENLIGLKIDLDNYWQEIKSTCFSVSLQIEALKNLLKAYEESLDRLEQANLQPPSAEELEHND